MKRISVSLLFAFTYFVLFSQTKTLQNRWKSADVGTIVWQNNGNLPHIDNIEMSGLKISAILKYGINSDSSFFLNRKLIWPMLRTIPNDTKASLIRNFDLDILKMLNVDGKKIKPEKVLSIELNGTLKVNTLVDKVLEIKRVISPSTQLAVYFESYTLKNKGAKAINVEVPACSFNYKTDADKGVSGAYSLEMITTKNGVFNLAKGDSIQFGLVISGSKDSESKPKIDLESELNARNELVAQWQQSLILETPNSTLNNAFAFAKVRASESIFDTKGGLMHSPGGEAYYAAIWANDQAEYVGPFSPFLGYDIGNKAAMNAYLNFARFMNTAYNPIPSSIIAEGLGTWNGAKDRGDQAMIAYGAARFALALGDKTNAEKLWPLIEWCLEFLNRNVNANGVVKSDADELEHRFPSGDANLCTSSLYYDALISANYLGKELNKSSALLYGYTQQAKRIKSAIESHFGAKVQGYDTYRYYEGNEVLRAWICMPLNVGIFERKEGTISALFSPLLWTEDGLATQAGANVFWDRSTLYALRGVFATGEKEKALDFLEYYSNRRLLGEHVPYPVEAYPEGNQRHLSAESALYCRVYTEGLFGIRPTSLKSFDLSPQLPKQWKKMSLKKIKLFAKSFDISVTWEKDKMKVLVVSGTKIVFDKRMNAGEKVNVKL